MKKTIELYEYCELEKEAQEFAIEEYKNNQDAYFYFMDDVNQSLKVFCDIVGIKLKSFIVNPYSKGYVTFEFLDSNKREITAGKRTYNYIIEHFYFSMLYRPKYKDWKNGKPRHFKQIFDKDCTLTGVCYDLDLLEDLYRYIEYPEICYNLNLEEVIQTCLENLASSVISEMEYRQSDEYIIESIQEQGYLFFKNGKHADEFLLY